MSPRAADAQRGYAVARLDEIEALADGRCHYRPVRHQFGITSFGVTAWVGAAAGDAIIHEFDEDSEPAEELFFVVSGRAVFELEDERVEASPGTLVFTRRGTRRTAVAAEPATTILVIDGSPGKAYDATGWELWAPLRPLYAGGDHAELSARLEEAIAANPEYPMLVYNLACCESLRGRPAEAIKHLRRAIDASEKFRANARGDGDFVAIHGEPEFRTLIGDQ
jgi:mannose-6-phosphate isomerase-like protein (cupin superfamily)